MIMLEIKEIHIAKLGRGNRLFNSIGIIYFEDMLRNSIKNRLSHGER